MSEKETNETGAMTTSSCYFYEASGLKEIDQIHWRATKSSITSLVATFASAMRAMGDSDADADEDERRAMWEVMYGLTKRLEEKLGPYPS
jgi:hypothetical protein